MQDVIHLFALVFPPTADCVFPWKIFFTTNLPSVWDWSAFCRFEEFIFSLGGIATMKTTTWLRTRSQELTRTALHQGEQSTAGKLNFQFSFCVPIRQKKRTKANKSQGWEMVSSETWGWGWCCSHHWRCLNMHVKAWQAGRYLPASGAGFPAKAVWRLQYTICRKNV